jgi:hypothetical protein
MATFNDLPRDFLLDVRKRHLSNLRETVFNTDDVSSIPGRSFMSELLRGVFNDPADGIISFTREIDLFDVKYVMDVTIDNSMKECILIHLRMKEHLDHDLLRFYMMNDDPYRSTCPGRFEEWYDLVLINKLPKTFKFLHIKYLIMMCVATRNKVYDFRYQISLDKEFSIQYCKQKYKKVDIDNILSMVDDKTYSDLYNKETPFKEVAFCPLSDIKNIKLKKRK